MAFESVATELQLKQQAAGLVTMYLQQMADAHDIPIAVETSLERPLIDPTSGEDLGIPLLGVLDLILDDRDGPLICDFKTAANQQHRSRSRLRSSFPATRSCTVARQAGKKAGWRSGR